MRSSILSFLLISLFYLQALGQDVFINEMSQGSVGAREWVELVVRTDGLDMREWELGDNNDGVFNQIVQFKNHADWSSVAGGTIIVIYNFNNGTLDTELTNAGAPDTDFSDSVVLIPDNNTAYFTGNWSNSGEFLNTDSDDAPAIRDASGTMIHDMAVTHQAATVSAPGSGKVKFFTSDDPSDLNNDSNWTEASASSGTPGSINPGQTADVLPVELVAFTALVDGRAVLLRWETASETNNAGFDIQHRMAVETVHAASLPWETLAFVEGRGTTERPQSYTYRAAGLLPGRHRLRLKQIDFDGTFEFSPEIEVALAVPGAYHLSKAYPNPFYPKTSFSLSVARGQRVEVTVYDLRGRRVARLFDGLLEAGTTRAVTFASGALPSGLYLIRVRGKYFVAGQMVVLAK